MQNLSVHSLSHLASFKTHFVGTPLKWVPLVACVVILFSAAVSVSTSATPESNQAKLQNNRDKHNGDDHHHQDQATRPFVDPIAPNTVDINSATPALLAQQLKGIGPAKALAIVQYRESNGAFKTVEALVNVKGIGPKTLAKIRSRLVAGAYSAPKPGESLLEREAAARAAVQKLLQRSRERSRAAERAATSSISRAE